MEVERNNGPQNDFLKSKLATDNNAILIFDECTSGFRETFGGLHMKYGVEPDMAMYGNPEMVMQLQQLLAKKKSWKLLKIHL